MDLEAKVTILQLNAQGRQVGRAISKGRVLCFLSRNENGIVTVSAPTTQVGVKGLSMIELLVNAVTLGSGHWLCL